MLNRQVAEKYQPNPPYPTTPMTAINSSSPTPITVAPATVITKDLLQHLREDIDAALIAVGHKHKVQLSTGNCSFSANAATFKLVVAALENGEAVNPHTAYLRAHFRVLGLKEEHLKLMVRVGGTAYLLDGYNPRSRTRPWLLRRVDNGVRYVFTEEATFRALGIKDRFAV